jgi:diguanylate cyclase (GGDEF)-like protein
MLTRRPYLVLVVAIVLSAFVTLISAWVMSEMRHDALATARAASYNMALLFERDTARNLEVYDLSLQAVIDAIQDPRLAALPADIRQNVLFDRSATARNLGVILVTDAAGNVVYDSRFIPPRKVNLADRDYFIAQRDAAHVGLFISRPFVPRVGPQEASIGLSRRLSNPDGSFAGIVVGTMRLDYFRQLFSGVDLGTEGALSLTLADGTLLMRRPYVESLIGSDQSATVPFQRFGRDASGGFFANGPVDGVRRWFAFRRVQGYPLVFGVALGAHDIYREWRIRAWIIGGLTGVLDVALIALGVLLTRQLRQRGELEQELREQAGTDPLTSLANRRAFEARANSEWQRARRTGNPLALMMLDVDRFKLYNDRYGHPAGDGALASVAHAVGAHARRAGDCAARYGGEEFVLMLPDTDEAHARVVAEQVRAAVEALAMPHEGSPIGVLTVSVGVASTSDGSFASWRSLTQAADDALYAAKGAGRNRVMAWQPDLTNNAHGAGVAG